MFEIRYHDDRCRDDFQPVPGDRLLAAVAMPRNPIPRVTPPTSGDVPPPTGPMDDAPDIDPAPTHAPGVQSPLDALHDLIGLLQAQPNMSDQMKLHIIREVMQSLAPPVIATPALTPGIRLLNDPIYATAAIASRTQE